MNPIISVKNLKSFYISNILDVTVVVKAVNNVTFDIFDDEIVGIAGESGCGKTTLLNTLMGIIDPPLKVFGGEIKYNLNNKYYDIVKLEEDEKTKLRWNVVSYIPQGSMSILNPIRKIKKIFFDFAKSHEDLDENKFERIVDERLESLKLPLRVKNSYSHQLSGGMRQRVAIALATIFKPKIVIADEPTTALDVVMQRDIIDLLSEIHEEEKNTMILVSHDLSIHANICARIMIMYAGQIVEIGKTETIFENPLHPYTKFLINSLPIIGDKKVREAAPGKPPSLLNLSEGCPFHERCPIALPICSRKNPRLKWKTEDHAVACFLHGGEDTYHEQINAKTYI
ncbi:MULTISPECIES: ABC transporter ATP-binding protein [Petrotoga]|uniref:Peptide/nickel transport system ATP-binding protein n=1 Tax=Petrotoga sibirica TaxID=156202 RepID=A0A4R8EUN3_9BACT|nr:MULTISPECIES: ABC transporter ATP-binding protein [Petrotoga]TDX16292.1 peptide/nickel transport system ATP-binding protein [Petrotoga sibirica]